MGPSAYEQYTYDAGEKTMMAQYWKKRALIVWTKERKYRLTKCIDLKSKITRGRRNGGKEENT